MNKAAAYGALLLVMGFGLAACGGGGGGGSSDRAVGTPAGDGAVESGIEPRQPAPPTAEDGDGGYALLTWKAPTSRADGSCLSDLAEFWVSVGLSPGEYDYVQPISASEMACSATEEVDACGTVKSCTYMVEDLPTASWYFAVQAVDSAGNISDYSNEEVKTIQ